ncbi:type IIG restriction enzyme/methyltransferase [Helicobacter pylori]|uniref:site-specific DNA-methyltransferase (adenine-specific) n=1 Tax=Helicobacter pylori TaxID=210 RepID=A0AAE7APY2_HELPX|nr:class I SAM-dependent DNA methyltransferase [Helicobacter pylori]QJW28695.1 class I SAM-dependent DNA methyltransferase [Helicobacter pylori A45]QJW39995.1 class I SAM-dependent DNA methyltransferase [Helicobacter pylori]QJW41449.1 class I SAM-dependent DNA methyltransferase [Helicobacter pylori]QJW42903.1 class I SAM-dependent DNA methyltransferase [Helicobacter pylori]
MISFTHIPLKDFIKKHNPQEPKKETIENFEKEINSLLENAPRQDDEEFQKNEINSFLKNTYGYKCNTYEKVDSAIYVDGEVWVLIEAKALNNRNEFPKNRENPLSKAFCQMVFYFLKEIENNNSLKHAIICNAHEFFLFDCKDFRALFQNDKCIKKLHKNCAKKEGIDPSTKRFYSDLEEYLKKDFEGELRYTHFNLSGYDPKELIYQVLSHEVLLKQRKTLDANTLNKDFYEELLYILGLEEQNDKGKILIKQSRTKNSLSDALKKAYNNLDDEEVMALLIAWNNRILFLRLLESLLISFNHFEKPFLTIENFTNFNALNTLFFEVLAKKNNERLEEIKENKILGKIPYLNSSLFDKTPLELKGHEIKLLDNKSLEIYPKSVFKKDKDYQEKKDLPLLEYLFTFLHVYDFTTTPKDIKDNKNTSESPLINPSVLGLVFEKLNGYKEGSFYTPSFITSYMCSESITPIVLDKFNQKYNIECENLKELKNYLKNSYKEDKRKEYLNTLLTLRVCDPAVGSGHFLVSVLNEMVRIAYELGLITSLHRYDLKLENDEIIIQHTQTGEIFNYTKAHSENDPHHHIQKELFELKKSIIENCLFGVDINPNSCEITKLRLWIELLKYSYYIFEEGKNTNALETLPNIDINIKCGNSLIFNFPLNSKLTIGQTLEFSKNLKAEIKEYKNSVMFYKEGLGEKAKILQNIAKLKSLIINYFIEQHQAKRHLKESLKAFISEYGDGIFDISTAFGMEMLKIARHKDNNYKFNPTLTKKQPSPIGVEANRLLIKIKECYETLENLKNSKTLEWRFEFPEVLNDEGDFLGFDCIIGNPPYIRQEQIKDLKPLLEKQYKDFYNSTADIYTYFFALSYHLLKEKGFNAFITSNKYARAKYGAKLRELLLKKTTIVSYMELNALKVFESATVDTSIMNFIKQTPPKESDFKYYEPTENDKDDLKSTPYLLMKQNALSTESFIFANATLLDLRDKIESIGTPLKDWDIQIYRGILTGANEAFIITTEKREEILNACKTQEERKRTEALIKPILRGKDIKRYSYEWAGEWVINTHNGYTSNLKSKIPPIDIEKYPALKSHLNSHYDTIAKRSDQGDTPYHLRNCAYLEDFEKEKIVYGEIVQEPRFYLDNGECELGGFYAEATSFILTGEHLCYLLGMLHSKLITFAFKTFYAGGGLGESGYRYKKAFIERLPIPKITPQNQELADKIIALVDKILKSKEEDPKANTQQLEKEIDALVYRLYNLTDEEIKIIEDGQ